MLFIPKKTKFTKLQKKKIKTIPTKVLSLVYGAYALKVKQNCMLTSNQLEMLNLNLSKGTKKVGKYWIRPFSHFSITSKPLEVRMGKGKGYLDFWVAKLKRGTILCEVAGLSSQQASLLFKQISLKLPVQTLFISKN